MLKLGCSVEVDQARARITPSFRIDPAGRSASRSRHRRSRRRPPRRSRNHGPCRCSTCPWSADGRAPGRPGAERTPRRSSRAGRGFSSSRTLRRDRRFNRVRHRSARRAPSGVSPGPHRGSGCCSEGATTISGSSTCWVVRGRPALGRRLLGFGDGLVARTRCAGRRWAGRGPRREPRGCGCRWPASVARRTAAGAGTASRHQRPAIGTERHPAGSAAPPRRAGRVGLVGVFGLGTSTPRIRVAIKVSVAVSSIDDSMAVASSGPSTGPTSGHHERFPGGRDHLAESVQAADGSSQNWSCPGSALRATRPVTRSKAREKQCRR